MSLIPAGSAESFVDLDGGQVRILRSTASPTAAARPLLMIHGGGTDNAAISWYRVFDGLGAEREVFAVDLPGFGRTRGIAPLGGAPAMAGFVGRAAARLGLVMPVVVGVSMGGDVALNLALRHPEVVGALILVAPGGLVPVFRNHRLQFAAWLAAKSPDWLLRPLTRLANRHIGTAIKAVVNDPSTIPPEVLAEFAREARRPGAGLAYARYNQASLGPFAMRNNLLGRVAGITVPTLFFHGQDDPIVDPEGSRRASRLMPHAELVLVPECGHWAQLEAPRRFLAEVRGFLERSCDGRRA